MAQKRPPLQLAPPPPPGWPDWMDQWVLPYVREPVLWPVLVAVLGHLMVILAPLQLAVWRTGDGHALLLLLALGAITLGLVGFELYRFRRPRHVAWTCALTWAAGCAMAWLGERTGIL